MGIERERGKRMYKGETGRGEREIRRERASKRERDGE